MTDIESKNDILKEELYIARNYVAMLEGQYGETINTLHAKINSLMKYFDIARDFAEQVGIIDETCRSIDGSDSCKVDKYAVEKLCNVLDDYRRAIKEDKHE